MRQLQVCEKAVRCLVYTPDGKELITGDESGNVRFFALPTGDEAGFFGDYLGSSIEALAIRPNGQTLAIGVATGEIALFDRQSKKVVVKVNNHPGGVRALAWSSDGKLLASSGWDKTVREWKSTLKAENNYRSTRMVQGLVYLPGRNQLVIVGNSGTMRYRPDLRQSSVEGLPPIFSVAIAPPGELLAYGVGRGEIFLEEAATVKPLVILTGHEGPVYSVAFNPTGDTLVSGGADGTVRIWDIPTRSLVETFRWHTRWVTCVAVAPDGMTAAAASADGTVVIWDLDH